MRSRTVIFKSIVILSLSLSFSAPRRTFAQTVAVFTNPIVTSGDASDPWMVYQGGYFYLCFNKKAPCPFVKGTGFRRWRNLVTGLETATAIVIVIW